jgi:hypothetical protein
MPTQILAPTQDTRSTLAAASIPAARPSRRLGAGAIAVVAGFAATFAISTALDAVLHATGVFPPLGVRMSAALFWAATAYRALATVAGGWVTARLAPAAPLGHAAILAGLGALAGLGGVAFAVAHPALGPLWYPVALAVTGPPCVLLGARLRARRSLG